MFILLILFGLFPALIRGWVQKAAIKRESKNAPKTEQWTYEIILN